MIHARFDLRPLTRNLNDLAKRQVPFAAALALTQSANLAKVAVTRQLPSIFDRPTPFTLNAITVKAATKRDLEARVFVKDRQASYLAVQETGGTTHPKKVAFVLPRAIGVNQYGNMPKGAVARAYARKGVFSAAINGVNGLYFSVKSKAPVLLALFTNRASYKPRFGFQRRAAKVAMTAMPIAFREALAKAMATAKRG